MFRLTRSADAEIERQIETARGLVPRTPRLLFADDSAERGALPSGFVRDFKRSRLGSSIEAFEAAKRGFARWAEFDLGWARVANPQETIKIGGVVAVEVRSLGLWSLNLSRIVDVVDTAERFGFVYSTTEMHVEQGEELSLLRLDPDSGAAWYELEAVSRPRKALAWLGYPVTRAFQHRFARDSHR